MKAAALIKQLRLEKGITQEELAERTAISVRTIQRIENGQVDPRAYTLQSIATALEVDFQVLIKRIAESGEEKLLGQNIHSQNIHSQNIHSQNATQNNSQNSRWLPLLHLSGLLLLIIPPIILWIYKRDKVENIQAHAYDVINFQLSMSLYLIPCVMFSIYPFLLVLGIYSQSIIIINTVRVINYRQYRYPLTIRFLKQQV